jgi:hypothetical protein
MNPHKILPDLAPAQTTNFQMMPWGNDASMARLGRTKANLSFQDLARYYEAQADKFLCGAASASMVLNSLFKDSDRHLFPMDQVAHEFAKNLGVQFPSSYSPAFRRFTQKNLFDPLAAHGFQLKQLYGLEPFLGRTQFGINLDGLAQVFQCYGLSAQVVHAPSSNPKDTTLDISHALSTPGHFVIANFDRSAWGMQGRGHISPIGAYDPISQSALLMDVNPCAQWSWIDINLLFEAMATYDDGNPRGYVMVSKK